MTAADEPARSDHEQFAKQANRETWALLQREDRSANDDEQMIHAAHASAFHWQAVGGPEESTRADWLLSHVYTVLGQPEPAGRYARQCLATCERDGIADFDLAYAYEAMARSAAAAGDADQARTWRARAGDATSAIADSEDRELVEDDLAAEPWFGMVTG